MLERIQVHFKQHRVPLALLSLAILIGQAAMLVQHPFVTTSDDTQSYINAAYAILFSARNVVSIFRTPGYPGFIALMFLLSGHGNLRYQNGLPHPSVLSYIVWGQIIIGVVTTYELYALAYLVTRNRFLACFTAILAALNLYTLGWERIVYSELLGYWSVATLLLAFVILIRYPRYATALVFGISSFVSIMVRPEMILLPLLLIAMWGLWSWRNRLPIVTVRQIALATVITYGLVLGYMALNAHMNHYFELDNDTNITLWGKVSEFHMQDLSVDPKYQSIQADTVHYDIAFAKKDSYDVPDPWAFTVAFSPARNAYYADGGNYTPLGDFAKDIILRHPLPFLVGSLRDVLVTWQATPVFYASFNVQPNGQIAPETTYPGYSVPGYTSVQIFNFGLASTAYEPWWVDVLLIGSSYLLQVSYILFPLLLLVAIFLMWRNRASLQNFIQVTLLICVAYVIFVAAFGNYSEFYRVRFPIDWAMIMVASIMVIEACIRLGSSQRPQKMSTPAFSAWDDETAIMPSVQSQLPSKEERTTEDTPQLKPWEVETLPQRTVRRT